MRTDLKIIRQYGCDVSKWVRARRKREGLANVQYLRFGSFFVIIATRGKHSFFEAEGKSVQDIRESPIKFSGYAVGCRERRGIWHASVRIEKHYYRELRRRVLAVAVSPSLDEVTALFSSFRFEPYAPIRQQLRSLLRAVNRRRSISSLEGVSPEALRLIRRPVLPFGHHGNASRIGTGDSRERSPAPQVGTLAAEA
ncbi:MAG: hypothetical protein AB9869_03640 [Verrucomicrobiia bacterium]